MVTSKVWHWSEGLIRPQPRHSLHHWRLARPPGCGGAERSGAESRWLQEAEEKQHLNPHRQEDRDKDSKWGGTEGGGEEEREKGRISFRGVTTRLRSCVETGLTFLCRTHTHTHILCASTRAHFGNKPFKQLVFVEPRLHCPAQARQDRNVLVGVSGAAVLPRKVLLKHVNSSQIIWFDCCNLGFVGRNREHLNYHLWRRHASFLHSKINYARLSRI